MNSKKKNKIIKGKKKKIPPFVFKLPVDWKSQAEAGIRENLLK